jgi:hypothetical protein
MTQVPRTAGNPASSLAMKWKLAEKTSRSLPRNPAEDENDGRAVPDPGPTLEARPEVNLLLVGLGLLPIVVNAVLAIVNAHIFRLGFIHAALAEALILVVVAIFILISPKTTRDLGPAILLIAFSIITISISLMNNSIQIGIIRNIIIVTFFALLGLRFSQKTLRFTINSIALIVGAFLIIEIFSVTTYVTIFQPAEYFASTRDLAGSEYNETGLFGNTLGWEGRFSLLNIMDHRGASLFLEQVSLGNFTMVLTIYLCCLWGDLARWERLALTALIALMLIATASRTATAFFVIAPLLAIVAPKLSRYFPLAIMPLCFLGALLVYWILPTTTDDNLAGRVGYTMRSLAGLDVVGYLGASAETASDYADSGYVYLVAASSIFGFIAYWLFVSLFPAVDRQRAKVGGLLLAVYIFVNLVFSGTSIFSIKTAPLLWLIVGHVTVFGAEKGQKPWRAVEDRQAIKLRFSKHAAIRDGAMLRHGR